MEELKRIEEKLNILIGFILASSTASDELKTLIIEDLEKINNE